MEAEIRVLLIDDGELDDVRDILNALDVDFAHLRGGAVPDEVAPPRDLFVTTSRRALLARGWHAAGKGPAKIAVVEEDSQTLRGMLRRIGFDYLVRRPVHPVALRLLLARALYQGHDKRGEERVTVGYPVTVRSRLRRRSAVLAELSMQSCSLITEHTFPDRASVTILLPAEIAGGKNLSLKGKVVRSKQQPGPDVDTTQRSVAVHFGALDVKTQRRMHEILKARAEGPAMVAASDAGGKRPSRKQAAQEDRGRDRRKHPRAQFEREIVALAGDARRVLLGRDLSVGGMRIDSHPELRLGARVRLAVYGSPREEPFLVEAEVVRDDGDGGLGLRFNGIEAPLAARLERMVAGLPAVETLRDGETDNVGTVLTELRST